MSAVTVALIRYAGTVATSSISSRRSMVTSTCMSQIKLTKKVNARIVLRSKRESCHFFTMYNVKLIKNKISNKIRELVHTISTHKALMPDKISIQLSKYKPATPVFIIIHLFIWTSLNKNGLLSEASIDKTTRVSVDINIPLTY